MTKRIFGLDLVRALAITMVLVSHLARGYEQLGYIGVEIFFALSGYLIGQIILRELVASPATFASIRLFWLRRWYRTLPNYYLFLFLMILFHNFYGDPPTISDFAKHLLFLQQLDGNHRYFFGVSWSLCVEEWFYILFPLLLIYLERAFRPRIAYLYATFIIIFASLLLRFLSDSDFSSCRKITYLRLDAIAYGALIAGLEGGQFSKLVFRWLGVLSMLGLVTFSCTSGLSQDRTLGLTVPSVLASLSLPLISQLSACPKQIALFGLIPLVTKKLSAWSYSIYLCHIPILQGVYAYAYSIDNALEMKVLAKLVALILIVTASGLLYRFFEMPMMSLRPVDTSKSTT